jgi:hypothetical protein
VPIVDVGCAADVIIYVPDQLSWTDAEKAFDCPVGDWYRITKGLSYLYTIGS